MKKMKCKICYKNEAYNTTGMCWKCLNEKYFQKYFGYCLTHGRWESIVGNGCPFCNQMDDFTKRGVKNTFMMFLWWHIIVYFSGILIGFLTFETDLYWIVLFISFVFGCLFASISKFLAKKFGVVIKIK
jgi:hypothetical protein